MKRTIFIILMAGLLGCTPAYIPPSPLSAPLENGKVLLVVDVTEFPTHTHIGTTIFNNKVRKYEYPWEMEKTVTETFTSTIESKTNLEVVSLADLGLSADGSQLDFVNITEEQWSLNEDNADVRTALLGKGVKAVVTITEMPTLAFMACSQYGCTNFSSEGYGLFTRSAFGFASFHASASFEYSAELLDPPAELHQMQPFSGLTEYQQKTKHIKGFEKPVDLKEMTEEELEPIRVEIGNHLQLVADAVVAQLNGEVPVAE